MKRKAICILRPLADQKGLTLMETLVAATLVLIAFAGLSQVVSMGRGMLDLEEDRRKAAMVLQAGMDAIRADLVYDDLADLEGTSTSVTVDGIDYDISRSVTLDSPEADAATLELTVTWSRPYKGNTVTRSLGCSTILAREGS